MFTSEEPTRFGIGCLGSRVLCGSTAAGSLAALHDAEGRAFDEIRTPRVSGASSPRFDWPRDISASSWSCTSSKGRSWSVRGFPSASSRRSRPQRQCAHLGGGGRTRGCRLDAGTERCLVRRGGNRAGGREAGLLERQREHRRHHGCMPGPPRGDEQHPRPGHARDRCPATSTSKLAIGLAQ